MASKFAKKTDSKTEDKAVKADKPAKAAKSTKPAKAEKKAPAKKEKAEKAEKGPDTRKLTLVTKENPKREGSKAAATYELYKKAKTVQDFLDAGGSKADIAYDVKAGHIKVA